MTQEELNEIVDRACSTTTNECVARSRHQETVINVILGKISNIEHEVGYLRGGTAWNDVAQRMLTLENKFMELSGDKPVCKEIEDIWNPKIEEEVWFISGEHGDVTIEKGKVYEIDHENAPFFAVGNREGDYGWRYSVFKTKDDAIAALRVMVEEACK